MISFILILFKLFRKTSFKKLLPPIKRLFKIIKIQADKATRKDVLFEL